MRTTLTQEVFTYCPIWAGWAAVDSDGCAYWYSHKPKRGKVGWDCPAGLGTLIAGVFDATDWENSLIKRQKEMKEKVLTNEVFQRDDCPKWAKWAAVDSDGIAFWFDEKPKLSHCGTFWVPEDSAPKCACITGKFSGTLDLIKRKQSKTNLEWLCEHPEELAKKLIRFDDRMGMFLAPDDKVFCLYDCDADTFIFDGFDQTERRCIDYTVNWLKQEHKENKHDTKQS